MERVAIVGVGLIGASFALALRKAGFDGELVGVSSERSIRAGVTVGAISQGMSLEEAAGWADLLYLSQPIQQILETLQRLGPEARPGCLITDAGSTKASIMVSAEQNIRRATFLGGHPMAGKESRGAEAADANLFAGRPYVLTTDLVQKQPGGRAALETFRVWLNKIGARVYEMDAAEHDRTVAFTSHLPQLLSTGLSVTLAHENGNAVSQIFGPGLIDMTRLALSAPEVWMSVLRTNKEAVLEAISAYESTLAEIKRSLADDRLESSFEAGSSFAKRLREVDFTGSTNDVI